MRRASPRVDRRCPAAGRRRLRRPGAESEHQPSAASPGASPASLPTELILGQTIWAYYDPDLERVVLVNGAQEQGPAKPTELWSWDGSAWELLDAAGPESRAFAAVGRDPERGVVVVQGGISSTGTEFDETLEWDGTDWTAHPGLVRDQGGATAPGLPGTPRPSGCCCSVGPRTSST